MKRTLADITLTIALGVVALLLGLNLWATVAPVQAAADPGNSCPLWKVAGTQLVYRCEDEQTGTICYSQGIMLFCVAP